MKSQVHTQGRRGEGGGRVRMHLPNLAKDLKNRAVFHQNLGLHP